jgi:hypothetical protein
VAGLWTRLGEQPGFGLDEDAWADQAFELGADVLGVLGHDRQVQRLAQLAGPQGTAEVGEGGTLWVSSTTRLGSALRPCFSRACQRSRSWMT